MVCASGNPTAILSARPAARASGAIELGRLSGHCRLGNPLAQGRTPNTAHQTGLQWPMAPILFRCPNTGRQVQGWIAEDVSENGSETYLSLACLACNQTHLINPKTGRALGTEKE
jgi:hypothetical protein